MLAETRDTNAFLIEAAKSAGTAEAKLALRNGADPDIVIDADGKTAMMHAAIRNEVGIMVRTSSSSSSSSSSLSTQ